MIGRLKRVPLREVWKHEASDFTRWLECNIDVISDAIGVELSDVKREQTAGSFSVDLIATDEHSNSVIIENQLEKSDHDHLGKVITYLTSYEAKTAIWIVSDPRPEHIAAITWLNQSTAASFYLFKLEAVRIGDSDPAPVLTLIVGPSVEGRAVGETKQALAVQDQTLHRFWSNLIERSNSLTRLHTDCKPGRGNWLNAQIGSSPLWLNYIARIDDARVELYIDSRDTGRNRRIFDGLYANKDQIESDLGHQLEWDNRGGREICSIKMQVNSGSGYRDESRWPEVQDAMIEAMIRFEEALRPFLSHVLTNS